MIGLDLSVSAKLAVVWIIITIVLLNFKRNIRFDVSILTLEILYIYIVSF